MRFISSITWIKKGVSKTPTRIKLEKEEMKQLFSEIDKNNDQANGDEEVEEEEEAEDEENDNEETKINRKYKMDNYDKEGGFECFE